jgi:hypothetical protein
MRVVLWTLLAVAVGAVVVAVDALWPRCESFKSVGTILPGAGRQETCTNHVVLAVCLLFGALIAGAAALRGLSAGRD